jgi:hypothetical protein
MNRFHIVVFNFERIASLLDNFDKIKNFRPDRDRLLILDCSINHESEKQRVEEFAQRRGWHLGKEVQVIRRKNWGIDQGARIDYLASLRATSNRPRYIWQFQEHYLDLNSAWSFWPDDVPQIGGQPKGDVIPDGLEIDLDLCERIYESNLSVSIIYADRLKIGVFTHEDGRQWLYADGGNFSVRSADILRAFTPDILDSYKGVYDGSYEWTLFLELDIGRQLTSADREWYDLVTHHYFADPVSLRKLEAEKHLSFHQEAESFYGGLYRKYEKRFLSVLGESKPWRKLHAHLSLWYTDLLSSGSMRRLRLVLESMGLAVIATRMRRYITGVLKHG